MHRAVSRIRRLVLPRPDGSYPNAFRVARAPRAVADDWLDPPEIDSPAEPLGGANTDGVLVRFDVDLFEALNREYESHPLAPTVPKYDFAAVSVRSRRRLTAIHRSIDLAGKTVLEVGCGSGLEVWHVANGFQSDAWGIDIVARRAWPHLAGERVHLIEGDMSSANGLPPDTFDRVLSNTVWEHIQHPIGALSEVYRVLKPGGLAWIRANLYRGPTASHRAKDIYFPFPHLLFTDEVIAEGLRRRGRPPRGAAWVNRLTWEQYEAAILDQGFVIRALKFDLYPLDRTFYDRFESVLGRYPIRDLERGFFRVVLEKPSRGSAILHHRFK